ncbi:S-layer homology domain-containing protein [Fusibacter tunisiensis]|uniref:SLH domain-containing protein n=1 Tax=Fusibacter tunisiensis TaxID=1008308 RepID=A0ABS2MNF3_9FIRM|nr:S-layer homology domain-containing protein [Fusibacter tunisiensis]MBM7560938.1 hypothetical protein [Fusibacter tunisiensis]
MKHWIIKVALSLLVILLTGTISHAGIIWMDGGVVGDLQISGANEYREVTFVTGKPVVLRGLVQIPDVPEASDTYRLNYDFELTSADGTITLERSLTYDVVKTENANIGQTTYEKTLTGYEETINTPNGIFTLGKYTFLEGRIIDNTPAVDYYSGNFLAERTYYIDGAFGQNNGEFHVVTDARPIVGYSHYWGANETQVIKHSFTQYGPGEPGEAEVIWSGTADVGMATTRKTDFSYQHTDPQNISFRGNYFKIIREENVLTYDYNMPYANEGAVDLESIRRSTGEDHISDEVILESKSLVIPRLRDIGGHWAEDNIFLLTSLEIFEVENDYFVPGSVISRLEFGKAVVNVINGKLPEPTRTEIIQRQRPGVDKLYNDISSDHPDYHYLEYIKENGIMNGRSYDFKGNEPLTRAEAITILVRALGIEYMAPAPPYDTHYADNAAIPEWAKDAIYMASEVGLVTGTPEGYINPNAWVKKDEASQMLINFINHLKDDISYDYREKILNR